MAYIERKTFEAKLIAAELARLFGSGKKKGNEVSPNDFLGMFGQGMK